MVAVKVTDLYRRHSKLVPDMMLCTLTGGFEDEINWTYYPDEISLEELAPIEEVLETHMPPLDRNYWRIRKIGDRYLIGIHTWTFGDLRGNTPQELAEELLNYYLRNPMRDMQNRSIQD